MKVSDVWVSNTAFIGRSINAKDKEESLMTWATPLEGVSKGEWYMPIIDYWAEIQPKDPNEFAPPFPVCNERMESY